MLGTAALNRGEEIGLKFKLILDLMFSKMSEIRHFSPQNCVFLQLCLPAGWHFVPTTIKCGLTRCFEVENNITLIPLASLDALKDWSEPISLLWIDGDHRYEVVKADFLGWEPFVVPGGVVVLHDTTTPNLGSARVMNEFILNSERFNGVCQVCTCTYATKTGA